MCHIFVARKLREDRGETMALEFYGFKVRFINDDKLDETTLDRKLGYMANRGPANIGNRIFGIMNRSDFPDLFGKALNGEYYKNLELAGVKLKKRKLEFEFLPTTDDDAFMVEVPLAETSGSFTAFNQKDERIDVRWVDGLIIKADRILGGVSGHIDVPD